MFSRKAKDKYDIASRSAKKSKILADPLSSWNLKDMKNQRKNKEEATSTAH